jgi:hypothetical protein
MTPAESFDLLVLSDYYDLVNTGWAITPHCWPVAQREAWVAEMRALASVDGLLVRCRAGVDTSPVGWTIEACVIGVVEICRPDGTWYPTGIAWAGERAKLRRLLKRDYPSVLPPIRGRVRAELDRRDPGWQLRHEEHD